ncbi:MAG: hypothetical protein IJD13_00475 [Oscillospiraceae bacterium]|nr:hypothetical protein [Oscillospiraceae bacterium]
MENIKEKIEEILEKFAKDEDLRKDFKKDPIATVEKLIGIDLPNDQIEAVVDAIKAKMTAETAASLLGGLGSLFKK